MVVRFHQPTFMFKYVKQPVNQNDKIWWVATIGDSSDGPIVKYKLCILRLPVYDVSSRVIDVPLSKETKYIMYYEIYPTGLHGGMGSYQISTSDEIKESLRAAKKHFNENFVYKYSRELVA